MCLSCIVKEECVTMETSQCKQMTGCWLWASHNR